MRIVISILALTALASPALAQVNVNGYYHQDGSYVQPYQRTAPDSSPSNNYSYNHWSSTDSGAIHPITPPAPSPLRQMPNGNNNAWGAMNSNTWHRGW